MSKLFTFLSRSFILLSFFTALSCDNNEDADALQTAPENVNQWIAATMRKWYYWHGDIPTDKTLNYTNTPDVFYKSLLSYNDGKEKDGKHHYYSTIKEKTTTTRAGIAANLSIGISIQMWRMSFSPLVYSANVMYVLPDSPAAKAGIVRGNWIHGIDNAVITPSNVSKLYGSQPLSVSWGSSHTNPEQDAQVATIVPAKLDDSPVLYHTIINSTETDNKKVGYMVYLHFTPKPDGVNSNIWDEQLSQVIGNMKNEGVDELVLDLRYNGGGLITSAQCLASLIAPQNSIGKDFCRVRYNDIVKQQNDYSFKHSENTLSLSRLFVLTGSQTASASEAIINGLRPFYPVILIGETTEGKNVGSITFTDKKYNWELHPIVCRIYNANDESDYVNGFLPDYEITGNNRALKKPTPLGDTYNDLALKMALQCIRGESPELQLTRAHHADDMQFIPISQPTAKDLILYTETIE